MMSSNLPRKVLCCGLLLAVVSVLCGEDALPSTAQQREWLERLNPLIGEWRGIAQKRRGSTQGAWQQSGEFVWDFSEKQPAVRYVVEDGQLAQHGRITSFADGKYQLKLQVDEQTSRGYTGQWVEGKLVFESDVADTGQRYRMTVTPLNEKRTLVLHEQTSASGPRYYRVAEVGYTRKGTRLALPGGGQRECVVTGGTAQTAVTFEGETYYVCCSGCQQAFDDDPAGVIADFKARIEERLKSLDRK